MSSDLVTFVQYGSGLIQLAILAIGTYRAIEMRRGFTDDTYRARALWSALVMSVIAITNLETFVALPNDPVWNIIGFIPFLALVGSVFAFVDKAVIATIRSDFFHRDVLAWSKLRVPAGSVLAVSTTLVFSAIVLTSQAAISTTQSFVTLYAGICFFQFSFVAATILGLGTLALIIGARRTPDKTLRKHIRLLGFALLSFVFSLVLFGASTSDAASILGNILTLAATYLLYLSTMSLTSLGHVEQEVGATSFPQAGPGIPQ